MISYYVNHVNQNISWVLGMLLQVLRISYRMKCAIILLAKMFLSFGKCHRQEYVLDKDVSSYECVNNVTVDLIDQCIRKNAERQSLWA